MIEKIDLHKLSEVDLEDPRFLAKKLSIYYDKINEIVDWINYNHELHKPNTETHGKVTIQPQVYIGDPIGETTTTCTKIVPAEKAVEEDYKTQIFCKKCNPMGKMIDTCLICKAEKAMENARLEVLGCRQCAYPEEKGIHTCEKPEDEYASYAPEGYVTAKQVAIELFKMYNNNNCRFDTEQAVEILSNYTIRRKQ